MWLLSRKRARHGRLGSMIFCGAALRLRVSMPERKMRINYYNLLCTFQRGVFYMERSNIYNNLKSVLGLTRIVYGVNLQ
jgi:hypothetical protein